MPRARHLIRRPSGIYVARFVVPRRLRALVGQAEVHRSTGSRELAVAKIVAFELAAQWHHRVERLSRMDIRKLTAGSVDLLGDGTISLMTAAERLGTEVADLTERLLIRGAPFLVTSRGWQGWLVPDLTALGVEHDAAGFVASVDVSPATLKRYGEAVQGPSLLRLAFPEDALEIVTAKSAVHVAVFKYLGAQEVFALEYPGVEIDAHAILVRRADVESLRASLVEALPAVQPGQESAGVSHDFQAMSDSIAKVSAASVKRWCANSRVT